MRSTGRLIEAEILLGQVEQNAPPPSYCTGGSCGLETFSLSSKEGQEVAEKFNVKPGDKTAKDVERAGLVLSSFERVEKARQAAGVPHPQKRGTLPSGMSVKSMLSGGGWQPVGESNPSFQVENLAS